jgi:hypothetical protein
VREGCGHEQVVQGQGDEVRRQVDLRHEQGKVLSHDRQGQGQVQHQEPERQV